MRSRKRKRTGKYNKKDQVRGSLSRHDILIEICTTVSLPRIHLVAGPSDSSTNHTIDLPSSDTKLRDTRALHSSVTNTV